MRTRAQRPTEEKAAAPEPREERILVKELIQGLVLGFLLGVLVGYALFA